MGARAQHERMDKKDAIFYITAAEQLYQEAFLILFRRIGAQEPEASASSSSSASASAESASSGADLSPLEGAAAAAVATRMAEPGTEDLKDGSVTWQNFCEAFAANL